MIEPVQSLKYEGRCPHDHLHATVSRYLNGHKLLEENRLKIEQAIEKLGFKENLIAIRK